MAKILLGSMPFVGHATPLLPIARELADRGHAVHFYTGREFRGQVEATGARFEPMQAAPDLDADAFDQRFPERERMGALARLKHALKYIFADSGIGQVADYESLLRRFPADVLLSDASFLGARLVHERGGPPWAVLNPFPLTLSSRDTAPFGLGLPPATSRLGQMRNRALAVLFKRVLFRDVVTHLDGVRRRLGLAAVDEFIMDAALSPYLYLQPTVKAFEYPRGDLAAQVHFIGPLLPGSASGQALPSWWPEVTAARQPVVHITQGTVANQPEQLLVPALQALADQDVLVVASTGGRPVEQLRALLPELPRNARLASFLPYAALLPHVDTMLTNGGYGGVQMALAHGVPLITAGTTEDKPEVSARVAWAGVGLNLKTATPPPARIGTAVQQVLADRRYRRRAQQLAAEIASHDAPTEAARLIERLVETRRPVVAAA
jgi:MGT family glycosyltransferase